MANNLAETLKRTFFMRELSVDVSVSVADNGRLTPMKRIDLCLCISCTGY